MPVRLVCTGHGPAIETWAPATQRVCVRRLRGRSADRQAESDGRQTNFEKLHCHLQRSNVTQISFSHLRRSRPHGNQ